MVTQENAINGRVINITPYDHSKFFSVNIVEQNATLGNSDSETGRSNNVIKWSNKIKVLSNNVIKWSNKIKGCLTMSSSGLTKSTDGLTMSSSGLTKSADGLTMSAVV